MSVGSRQQVSNATALYSGCELILLDEPFSGLDNARRAQLRESLLELSARRKDTTFIVTSQYATDLVGLGEHVIPIDQGTVGAPIALDEAREQFPIVRGTTDCVDEVTSGHTVIDEKKLGTHKIVVLRGALSPSQRAHAEAVNVALESHGDADLINLIISSNRSR